MRRLAHRCTVVQVVYSREGDTQAQRLEAMLIDEATFSAGYEGEASLQATKLGFSGWLGHIETQVAETLAGGTE